MCAFLSTCTLPLHWISLCRPHLMIRYYIACHFHVNFQNLIKTHFRFGFALKDKKDSVSTVEYSSRGSTSTPHSPLPHKTGSAYQHFNAVRFR